MNVDYGEDVRDFREGLAPEFQRIFDHLAPHTDDQWGMILSVVVDYYPANALYSLTSASYRTGVIIPEDLFRDAERVVAEDGPAEDYMLDAIRNYRAKHYPTAA